VHSATIVEVVSLICLFARPLHRASEKTPREVEDAQLEGRIHTREEALAMA
jgi:hypothetical protein